MTNALLITHDFDETDETSGIVNVANDNGCHSHFTFDNFQITNELNSTDNEDFNDNARWMAKTLLEILKMEYSDEAAHLDWSADADESVTGKYRFSVKLEKAREQI